MKGEYNRDANGKEVARVARRLENARGKIGERVEELDRREETGTVTNSATNDWDESSLNFPRVLPTNVKCV